MKNLYSWDSLREYGINPLTGESCAYGMRLLCDLTERGAGIIAGYFGLAYRPVNELFRGNWNSNVNGVPAVASVMLPRTMITDLLLYIAFHVEGSTTVIETPGGSLVVLNPDDEFYGAYNAIVSEDEGYRVHRNPASKAVSRDGRNIHAMSGRVE
jgi:hypothetical protein